MPQKDVEVFFFFHVNGACLIRKKLANDSMVRWDLYLRPLQASENLSTENHLLNVPLWAKNNTIWKVSYQNLKKVVFKLFWINCIL